jgi:IS5 family transposase
VPWAWLSAEFETLYSPGIGRPAIPIRLMAGLVLLQHTLNLSDEDVVQRWPENPY